MKRMLTKAVLGQENLAFSHTHGTSQTNRGNGFMPAFCNTESGQVELSRFADGGLAPMHLLDGLPEDWVATRDDLDGITAVKPAVVAGFVRGGRFYTREEAAEAVLEETGCGCDWLTETAYA
jgi:hypothetical protein